MQREEYQMINEQERKSLVDACRLQGLGNAAKDVGEVTQTVNSFEYSLDRYDTLLKRLSSAVDTVSHCPPPVDCGAKVGQSYETAMARQLGDYRYKLDSMNDCLEDIINRIAL